MSMDVEHGISINHTVSFCLNLQQSLKTLDRMIHGVSIDFRQLVTYGPLCGELKES